MQEQAELWMALRDRMKENWGELTIQEKKAGELGLFQLRPTQRNRHARGCSSSADVQLSTERWIHVLRHAQLMDAELGELGRQSVELALCKLGATN